MAGTSYYIELSGKRGQGLKTIVDEDVYLEHGHKKWHLNDSGYVLKHIDGKHRRLHRIITQCPEDRVIDHLNGDRLDNRRANLRICTQRDNNNNRKNVKGYCWDGAKSMWMVRYKGSYYGRYATREEAIEAFKRAKSGVPYEKSRRKLRHLPAGISKQFGKYRARPQVDGVRYWLGQYDTVDEAVEALNNFKNRKEG